jgi:hypothetical protein
LYYPLKGVKNGIETSICNDITMSMNYYGDPQKKRKYIMISRHIVALISLMACVAFVGCESSDKSTDGKTEFKNQSSSTVTVSPGAGESFAEFTLTPNQSLSVDRNGDNIDYTYKPTGKVIAIDVTNLEVIFSNPINL